ncbi:MULTISPECIES: aldose 1-epimerase family protein [Cryobacterium]|uniref:aldose 1-epimerase family protein n=1 Tax=Cryobacterium TaxID=69578 RepID=UPI000CD483E5|nr:MULTISPECIES: aldose 1-epimerase family protein [Cryobacterium]POH70600.1 galactose mutarotase [Cryobacterium zongtaii]TFC44470.1 galactose mutarotase [Cryobacterium sp. TMN-39-2]TFC50753.1 galactose mutarotase [Cryobacterium sp. TMB3-1-2]TFC73114.1 galactose mutarotase [Cryobacterium sp. TMB3-15]TFC73899.1 galactose mutarotase [Cryobacterium sp. TMB3-10]
MTDAVTTTTTPTDASVPPLSGLQYTINHDGYSATIASVGASLRLLTWHGRHLVVPFDADEVRPGYRGAVLAPWPNRVVDGSYTFDGLDYQLPLTEPSRSHALHGLVCWADWSLQARSADSVTLGTTIVPSDGYPHRIALLATYSLADDGLTTTVTAENRGTATAPYGTGPHPYLVAGPGTVDDWTLEFPAASYLTVTPDRLSPVATVPVETTPEFDFRTPRAIGDTFIDHAFTAIARGAEASASVTVTSPAGTGVRMSFGAELPWLQVHTADRPAPERSRIGLAVEPMTCPPNAFSTGEDLVLLAPGTSHSASWTVAATEA